MKVRKSPDKTTGRTVWKEENFAMIQQTDDGYIVNINKPGDWSSFDVVRKVRGITRIKKVGHAGTLDPFATGVLLICLGKATRKTGELMNLPKEYVAEMEFGKVTDTLDPTGKIIGEENPPPLNIGQIKTVMKNFVGTIKQRIPDYAAAKVNGQRLYKLARSGKPVPEKYKTVEIYRLDLLDFKENILKFRVLCGRGTYVRALAADLARIAAYEPVLARELRTIGYLRSLTRTRVGAFTIENALTIEQFQEKWKRLTVYENIS